MPSPFCPIQKKTEWYLRDTVNQVVACEDLNPRGYKYRILVVGSGFRWHRHWKKYTEEDKTFLVELTNFIAKYLLSIGKGKKLVKIDTEHFSYPEHGHCQACIL